MKKLFTLSVFSLFAFYSCYQQAAEEKPNIVLIMADDMGYECIGANGNTEYKTPNIDRLAKAGVRFEHCYSQPLCTPSRVKIMTGKYNFRNYEDFGYLNPNQKTFGNLLQDAGYATCIAGKWQLNGLNRNNPGNQDVSRPNLFGFDEYCLWQVHHQRKEGERYTNPLITQNGEDLPRDSEKYGPDIFVNFIEDFIDRKSNQPFFIYYPMVLVHDPFVPTPDSPDWEQANLRYKKDTAYFADMVAYTDKITGKLETKLKESGVWENTLFIFTGDNGTNKNIFTKTNYGTIKGAKGQSINTGNHVPLIVTWPAKMKGQNSVNTMVSFADVLPTLCEAAGISTEKYKSDGKSFIPLITTDSANIQDEIFIHYSPRWGNFKHTRWVMNNSYKLYQDGRFFNCAIDSLEKRPLQTLTEKELMLKERFQKLLEEKEDEIPFSKNDTLFNLSN